MVDTMKKPKSALKRPNTLKHRSTVVYNNSTSMKKVTLVTNDEELVALSPERRNWRGIFIALLVIAAVFSLIIFSIFLLSPEEEGIRLQGRLMTLNDVLGKSLVWHRFNGTWSNRDRLIYRDATGGISELQLENYTSRVLMPSTVFRQLNAESFVVSPNQQFVLLQTEPTEDGFRNYIYEVRTSAINFLAPHDSAAVEPPRLQNVVWSRFNASMSSPPQGIAFVHQNDIYYKPDVQAERVHRLTTTGRRGVIYNGVPDWTYGHVPELSSQGSSSMQFSPSGQYLAYLTFNDSEVSTYKYTWMGDDLKYPTVRSQRYPKAGEKNPHVTVHVVDLQQMNSTQLQLPGEFAVGAPLGQGGGGGYIGALTWASESECSVIITNRPQTKANTVVCRPPDFYCEIVHTEVRVANGWVLPNERPIFASHLSSVRETSRGEEIGMPEDIPDYGGDDGRQSSPAKAYEISNNAHLYLLKRLPVRDGEHGHFRHVVFVSSVDRRPVPLTMGRYEVTEILAWDVAGERVYFMAAPEGRPGERHLYRLQLTVNVTRSKHRAYITSSHPVCMTCDNTAATFRLANEPASWRNLSGRGEGGLFDETSTVGQEESDEDGPPNIPNNCQFNRIYFNEDYTYYVQECLGPDAPSVYLVDVASNYKVFVLNSGDVLRQRLAQLAVPQIKLFSVEVREGFQAQVKVFVPPEYREGEEVAYPMILHIDASPGSQLVSQMYHVDWNWYLCSQRTMVVVQIDASGSGYQGELLRTQLHGKLGGAEVEDQLSVLSYLKDNLRYVDPNRICAYGWGYGGYVSAMALIEDSQQMLQCAVAINPVVSFGYHYSFFTERFIPFKGDYIRALQDADLSLRAGNIKGRNLMLMHGSADTLIHQDHTLMLVRALVDEEVKFWHQVYPDDDHSLSKSLNHVFKTMEWYFDESFGPADENWDPTRLFLFKQ